jgi:hypothetical protein
MIERPRRKRNRRSSSARVTGALPRLDPEAGHDPLERRAHLRHVTLEYRAWLAWWTEDGRLRTADVRLLDISRGGACAEAARFTPRDRSVLLALQGLGLTEGGVWTQVVALRRGTRGTVLHLEFEEPCPEALYRGALEGVQPAALAGS